MAEAGQILWCAVTAAADCQGGCVQHAFTELTMSVSCQVARPLLSALLTLAPVSGLQAIWPVSSSH